MFNNLILSTMSAKQIQLTQGGVLKYPRTIDEAIAVLAKSKKLSTVLAELEAEDSRLNGLIVAAQGAIDTLNGSGEGSVDKKVTDAINDFATKLSDNGAIDTFKELVDYVAEHGSEFSALVGRVTTAEGKITTVEGKVATLEGDNTTNKANIAANTEAINGLNGKVGSSADGANADGSLYARIAQVKADLAALSGDGGTVSEQINAAIEANNTSVVAPISEKVNTVEGNLNDHIADNVKHITAAEREAWNAKIDYTEVGDTTYPDFDEIALS